MFLIKIRIMAYTKKKTKNSSSSTTSDDSLGDADTGTVSSVLKDYERGWRTKQVKDILFTDIYRRYRSYLDITQQVSRSTLFIPKSFTAIETIAPRMTAKKPTFKVLPRKTEDITKADTIGQLLDYRYDVMHLQEKIKIYVKQALLYGTSFVKLGWDADKQSPEAYPVDIADIFGDPVVPEWQDGFIIHRFYKEVSDLENSKIKYKNLDKLKARQNTMARDERLRQERATTVGIPFDPDRDGIECLEWWGRVDGKIKVQTIADRSILIRDEFPELPLDEYPFVELYDQRVPFEKWGIGEIEPIINLQDELNTTRNQRVDEKNLSIHNMWVVSKLAGIDYSTIVSKPGGIILANDINGIKPLEKQNITQDSVTELSLIDKDIQETSGVNDYIKGLETGSDTATETVAKTQESNQRFAEKINNLEIALKKIGRWIVAFDATYLTKNVEVRVLGKFGLEMKTIKPSDIRNDFDIDIESGSSLPANPDLRRQQLIQLVQTITPILSNPNGIPDGMRELLRELIQSFDLKNTDEILQGADHPLVGQALAKLDPSELEGANPQMIQSEIKRQLMGSGQLNQAMGPKQAGAVSPMPAPSQPAQPIQAPIMGASGQ